MTTDAHAPSKKVVRAGFFILSAIGVRAFANVLLVRLGLKLLGEQNYGLFVLMQSLIAYLNLSDLGIGQSIMNAQSANAEKRDWQGATRILSAGVSIYAVIALLTALVVAIAVFAFAPAYWRSTVLPVGDFQQWMLVLAPFSLAVLPLSAFSASLAGLRDLDIRYIWEIGLVALMTAATAVAMYFSGSVFAVLLAPLIVQFTWYWLPYLIMRKRHPAVEFRLATVQKTTARTLLGSSAFIFLISLSILTQRYAANFITSGLISLEAVARVQPHILIFQVFGWSMTDAVTKAMLPYVTGMGVRGDWEKIRFIAQICAKTTLLVAGVFSASIWSIGEPAISLWLGKGNYLGDLPLLLLIGIFLLDSSSLVFTNLSLAIERHRARALLIAVYALTWAAGGAVGADLAARLGGAEYKINGMFAGSLAVSFVFHVGIFPFLSRRDLSFPIARHFRSVLLPSTLTVGGLLGCAWFAHVSGLGGWTRGAVGVGLVGIGSLIFSRSILYRSDEWQWIMTRIVPKRFQGFALFK